MSSIEVDPSTDTLTAVKCINQDKYKNQNIHNDDTESIVIEYFVNRRIQVIVMSQNHDNVDRKIHKYQFNLTIALNRRYSRMPWN